VVEPSYLGVRGDAAMIRHGSSPSLCRVEIKHKATEATEATEPPFGRTLRPTVAAVPDEPLITTGEVARRLGVTPRAVGRWVARGHLTPAVTTPGGRYRFLWSEVREQLRSKRQADE
jgi:excisionase family DNA binding protein